MSKRSALRIHGLAVVVLVTLWHPDAADAADPFYERLLEDGIQAHDFDDHARAVKNLRLACFGLLEEPRVLARGLTYLAIAQAEVGDDAGFATTFERILEVEGKFQAFSALDLDADLRPAFEGHVQRVIAIDVLNRSPAFLGLARRKLVEQIHLMAPDERRQALERQLAVEPNNPTWGLLLAELELDSGEFEDVLAITEAVLAGEPRIPRALCLRGRAAAATGSCEQALADLDSCQELVEGTLLLEARLRCLVRLGDWPGASTLLAEVPSDRQKKAPFKQLARDIRKGLTATARPSPQAAAAEGEATGQSDVATADPTLGPDAIPVAAPDSPGGEIPAPTAVPETAVPDTTVEDTAAEAAAAPDTALPEATAAAPEPAIIQPPALETAIPVPEAAARDTMVALSEPSELRAEIERIQQLVPSGSREQLEGAFDAARELADRYPQHSEPQHLAAEIAYRLSRWQDAVTFFQRGGEPSGPDRLFYFSLALFKTGDRAEARRALERCLPALELTGFVRSYVDEILGPGP